MTRSQTPHIGFYYFNFDISMQVLHTPYIIHHLSHNTFLQIQASKRFRQSIVLNTGTQRSTYYHTDN